MLRRPYRLPRFMVFIALLWFGATALAQTSVEAFREVLRDHATFTTGDLSLLEQGQMVAKLLAVKDKREVAVCGVVKLEVPLEAFLQATRDNVGRRTNQAILQIGKFSNPPTIEDLQTLTLENRDIEDLKQCVVGGCALKMPAAMIERVRREVDWAAPDYRLKATQLFKSMLMDYVRDYLARGDAALMEYNDRSQAVHLDEEHRSLLDSAIYFNQFAPEFAAYLKNFPRPELAGVENALFWSRIKFGLKPVITITHVVIYARRATNAPQALVASKQIYADHYFDSSLALSALINIPGASAPSDSYLLYTNRSRADALGGFFSGLKRSIVESQAIDGLKTILQETKLKMEASAPGGSGPSLRSRTEVPAPRWWDRRWFAGRHLFWWLFVFISVVGLFWLGKAYAGRRAR